MSMLTRMTTTTTVSEALLAGRYAVFYHRYHAPYVSYFRVLGDALKFVIDMWAWGTGAHDAVLNPDGTVRYGEDSGEFRGLDAIEAEYDRDWRPAKLVPVVTPPRAPHAPVYVAWNQDTWYVTDAEDED